MATEQKDREGSDGGFDAGELLFSVAESYRYIGMPVRRYVLVVLLPAVVVAVVLPLTALLLGASPILTLPLGMTGVLVVLAALLYPKIVESRLRKQARERFHLFLTHITVLSLSNIERVEVFRRLSDMDEYESLADEMGRVVALVDGLNQSLDDACRRRAKRTPSNLLSDFLDRLAYTAGAGQPVSDFLTNEQEGFIKKFVVRYESDLRKLDVLKEMYVALMLAVSFVLVFSTIIPILIDVSPVLLVVGVVSMFCLLQVAFLVLVNSVSPTDPLWCRTKERGSPVRRIWKELVVGVVLTAVTVPFAYLGATGGLPFSDALPLPLWLGVAVTPLALPGFRMRQEGKKVQKRDEDFPAFIRALGSVESVKQSSTASVLESLRRKDFGELTDGIESLYRRLNVRVDSERAWSLFAAETGSYLIHKFGDMYVTGRRMGGDPETLGLVISRNFEEVVRVREQRAQATMTFIGVLYGITAAVVFASFVGFEITKQMVEISQGISDVDFDTATALFSTGTYNVVFIEFLLLLFVLLNAFFSAVSVRLIDRRHPVSGLVHFVALCWIGAVVATLTKLFVGPLMGM